MIGGCVGPRGDGYRAERPDVAGRGAAVPPAAGRDLRGHRGGFRQRAHAHVCRRGDRNRARRAGGGDARRDLVHRGNRRTAARAGESLGEAVEAVDERPAALSRTSWSTARTRRTSRTSSTTRGRVARAAIRGVRANASTKSHAELDEAEELDEGDPAELAGRYRELRERMPNLNVVGGCCGTDDRHIDAICAVVVRRSAARTLNGIASLSPFGGAARSAPAGRAPRTRAPAATRSASSAHGRSAAGARSCRAGG